MKKMTSAKINLKIILPTILLACVASPCIFAQQPVLAARPVKQVQAVNNSAKSIDFGRRLLEEKKNKSAAVHFYQLLYGKSMLTMQEKTITKYYFGLALLRSNLLQMASFNFLPVSLSPNKKLANSSFELLVKSASGLEDQSLLNYSLRRADVDSLAEFGKEFLFNSLAKTYLDSNELVLAQQSAEKTLSLNPENEEAAYLKALAHIKKGQNNLALPLLEQIYKRNILLASNSVKRNEATVALARVNFNLKKWTEAAELYKEIPKDSHLYRQVLLELSWTYFRNSQFRSALSTIHSLNTPYYENFYDPESLVLRSIILLFVCQPNDMERSIQFFNKYYVTAYEALKVWNQSNYTDARHYLTVEKLIQSISNKKKLTNVSSELPYFFFRSALENPEIRLKVNYLNKIKKEKKILNAQFSTAASKSFLAYGNQILDLRIRRVSLEVGSLVKNQLRNLEVDLGDFVSQFEFINYEFLSMKKTTLLPNQDALKTELPAGRNFLVSSGFQYYPFDGEYWRDEIGNYQYLGKNACENEH